MMTHPPLRLLRQTTVLVLMLALLALMVTPVTAQQRELYVAPGASNNNPGTLDRPFGTLGHALGQLRPGDTLYVRGGEYRERLRSVSMPSSTSSAPTRVVAYPGENPVVRGLLWVQGGSHWVLDGINVTWDLSTGSSNEHMVKVTNGTDWVVRNAEISNAHSFAGMLIAGDRQGQPARWRLEHNCIRDTAASNGTNQNHNLYVNSGLSAGPGVIEGNLFYGAPNGENIKLGPPGSTGGTANVLVRHNTLYDAAQNLLISGGSSDNLIERNILGKTRGNYGSLRSYQITGTNNVARNNVTFDSASSIDNYGGGNGIQDGGGNRHGINPNFNGTSNCSQHIPRNSQVDGHGHTTVTSTTTSPAPNPVTTPIPPPVTPPTCSAKQTVAGDPAGFRDIAGSAHEDNIRCMAEHGLTEGVGNGSHYAPRREVTRGQMASFVARFLETYTGNALPTGDPRRFDDVPTHDRGYPHASSIHSLAAIEVVGGTASSGGDAYAPQAGVTRGQMASMIRRALAWADDGSARNGSAPPRGAGTIFHDTAGSVHQANIDAIAAVGVVQGFGDRTYRPGAPVVRDQMASFVMRSYGYALAEKLGRDE
jgi:hypothetical protein